MVWRKHTPISCPWPSDLLIASYVLRPLPSVQEWHECFCSFPALCSWTEPPNWVPWFPFSVDTLWYFIDFVITWENSCLMYPLFLTVHLYMYLGIQFSIHPIVSVSLENSNQYNDILHEREIIFLSVIELVLNNTRPMWTFENLLQYTVCFENTMGTNWKHCVSKIWKHYEVKLKTL